MGYPKYRSIKSQARFIKSNAKFVNARENVAGRPKRAVAYLSFVLMAITFVFAVNNNKRTSDNFRFHFPAALQPVMADDKDIVPGTASSIYGKDTALAPIATSTVQAEQVSVGDASLKYISSRIKGSIFASGNKAGLSGKIINNFINIFHEELNFAKDVHSGDEFAVLCDNQGKIQAAEITVNNKIYRAIAFADKEGQINYYAPNGYSLSPAFMRYPVQYKYISSKFSLHRYHPILHKYCAHLGVDLAADVGSPVRATSDGVIEFAGRKENYGKVVIVAHHQYSTLYAHLSRIGNIGNGSTVKRGTVIGYLGSTGLSTGPHVHYEFRINGVHYDPQKVKLPHDMIANVYRSKFLAQAKTMTAMFDSHHDNTVYAMHVKKEGNLISS